jgi:hypothetical protein
MPTPPRRRWFQFSMRTMFVAAAIVSVSLGVAWLADDPMAGLWTAAGFGSLYEGMMRTPWVALGTAIGALVALVLTPQVQMSPPRGPSPVSWIVINLFLAGIGFAVGLAIDTSQSSLKKSLDQ